VAAEVDILEVASLKILIREDPNSWTNDPATSENQTKIRYRILARNQLRRCREKQSCSSERDPAVRNCFRFDVSYNLFDVVVVVVVVAVVDFDVDFVVEVVDDMVREK